MNKTLLIGWLVGWGGIGFYRGTIDYEHKRYYRLQFTYIDMVYHGLFGMLVYITPCFLPYTIYKELYRLEVYIRKLKDYDFSFYNRLL